MYATERNHKVACDTNHSGGQRLSVDESKGSSTAEVKQRLKKYGRNELSARGGVPVWLRFARQFNQAVVYILLAAAAGCFLLGEVVDAFVIISVVVVNAIVGFIQEAKAGALN